MLSCWWGRDRICIANRLNGVFVLVDPRTIRDRNQEKKDRTHDKKGEDPDPDRVTAKKTTDIKRRPRSVSKCSQLVLSESQCDRVRRVNTNDHVIPWSLRSNQHGTVWCRIPGTNADALHEALGLAAIRKEESPLPAIGEFR